MRYLYVFMKYSLCIQSAAAAAAVALCVAILLLLVQLLLRLFDILCQMANCWFIESDSSVFFLFMQTGFICSVLFGSTVDFTASICLRPR